MKFQDLLLSILSEQPSQKQLSAVNSLKEKLKSKWGRLGSNDVDKYFDWFQKTKDSFTPDNVSVRNFLYRFDGNHGYEKFQPEKPNNLSVIQNMKLIDNYTQRQIVDLYYEFQKNEEPEDDEPDEQEVFDSNNRAPTPEKTQASKKLWYGEKNLIYSNGGFRVYEIPNQFTSINYGYYLNTYHQEPYLFQGGQWCTTWWNNNNYYASKRVNRYFYFIIDESKHPDVMENKEISKFYLSAFQVFKPGNVQYALTDITNPGEPPKTKQELLNIYPKLSEVLDKLVFKPYDAETELTIKNVITQINEQSGSKYEYIRMSRKQKLLYITNGGTLSKKISWEYSDKILRNTYIMNSTRENLIEKFSSFDLFSSLSSSDLKSLNAMIDRHFPGKGLGLIRQQTMTHEFIPDQRKSIINPNISLYQRRNNKHFGLYNELNGEWVSKNGVTYSPEYQQTNEETFSDENGEFYLVEVYTKNRAIDNTTFYCIFPLENDGVDGYFVSHTQWLILQEKISMMGDDMEFNANTETDIKEIGE